jgi:hypothetical protein
MLAHPQLFVDELSILCVMGSLDTQHFVPCAHIQRKKLVPHDSIQTMRGQRLTGPKHSACSGLERATCICTQEYRSGLDLAPQFLITGPSRSRFPFGYAVL